MNNSPRIKVVCLVQDGVIDTIHCNDPNVEVGVYIINNAQYGAMAKLRLEKYNKEINGLVAVYMKEANKCRVIR